MIAVAIVIVAGAASVAVGQSVSGTAAPASGPVDVYRAFIADYAAGRPVCAYLTEDARASDLGGVVDSALELFEASAPPVLASPEEACESIRAGIRKGLLRAGLLRASAIVERSLSPTLSVLTVNDERVLMERDVRTGAWLIVSDTPRAVINAATARLEAQKAGSESPARLQDALAALGTEATRARRRFRTLLARRGADASPVARCRGRSRTITGQGPLRSATLRISPTSLCLTLRARDVLPVADSPSTLTATVILLARTRNPLRIQAARLAGAPVLLQADGSDGARDREPLSVLVKPARWAFGTSSSLLRLRLDLLPHQARKLRRSVRWVAALDRLAPGRESVIGTLPRVDPDADVVRPPTRLKLAVHPGSG